MRLIDRYSLFSVIKKKKKKSHSLISRARKNWKMKKRRTFHVFKRNVICVGFFFFFTLEQKIIHESCNYSVTIAQFPRTSVLHNGHGLVRCTELLQRNTVWKFEESSAAECVTISTVRNNGQPDIPTALRLWT